jgi:hypothetical protein
MKKRRLSGKSSLRRGALALAFCLSACVYATAQSPDLNAPKPIGTNEINGRITPRDLGDPRLTSHYYTFNGTQGDIILTIESVNLDGAVDLFLSEGLRPLMQVTLFSGTGPLAVTKSVFLRTHETLILRIEARTPNDTDGTYHIQLGGTFQPAPDAASAQAQSATETANQTTPPAASRGTHRVNAVGARIDEPEPPAPEPTPTETARPETPPRATTAKANPARRTRTPGAHRTTTARNPAPPEHSASTNAPAETPAPATTEAARTETPAPTKPAPARSPRGRTPTPPRTTNTGTAANRAHEPMNEPKPNAANEATTAAAAPTPQLTATRLVIEIKDGTKVEHEMSSIRSMTVSNQAIVVLLRNGRIERYALTNVARMTLEP